MSLTKEQREKVTALRIKAECAGFGGDDVWAFVVKSLLDEVDGLRQGAQHLANGWLERKAEVFTRGANDAREKCAKELETLLAGRN